MRQYPLQMSNIIYQILHTKRKLFLKHLTRFLLSTQPQYLFHRFRIKSPLKNLALFFH